MIHVVLIEALNNDARATAERIEGYKYKDLQELVEAEDLTHYTVFSLTEFATVFNDTDDDDHTMTTYLENNFMTYVSFGGV